MPDLINVEILEDGTISYKTDEISGINHASADLLLKELEEALGGQVVRKIIPHKHNHQHQAGKVHAH